MNIRLVLEELIISGSSLYDNSAWSRYNKLIETYVTSTKAKWLAEQGYKVYIFRGSDIRTDSYTFQVYATVPDILATEYYLRF